jgi:phospholipid/cholesterol/gamma-HCH transport system permease protein
MRLAEEVGRAVLGLCEQAGGMMLLLGRVARDVATLRFDRRETLRHLATMGADSVPIVLLTAFFTGGIMVIQAGIFVRRFNAQGLLGYGAGFATLREVGPILIALMFSGRVGANNAAELGTMTVTEQLDGLRALGIDPVPFLLTPRVLAMMISLFCLTLFGDAVAIAGGALFGKLLIGVELSTYFHSFADHLKSWDLLIGLIKAAVFGLCISLSSCHFGVSVKGGAVGVGRAVNDAVAAAAVAIMVSDHLLTVALR